jgi:hypothetical protein
MFLAGSYRFPHDREADRRHSQRGWLQSQLTSNRCTDTSFECCCRFRGLPSPLDRAGKGLPLSLKGQAKDTAPRTSRISLREAFLFDN